MCSRVTNPAPDLRRSRAPVLVVSVPPGSGIPGILVSAQGRQVEEAERAHQLLDAAGVGRVRVWTTPPSSANALSPSRCRGARSTCVKLYSAPCSCCSSVNAAPKSYLKSLPRDETHGKLQPIRAAYA